MSDADKKLADAYAGIFRAFVKHRASVKMVTFWGVNDAVSWRAQGRPLLFDGNDQLKPALTPSFAPQLENKRSNGSKFAAQCAWWRVPPRRAKLAHGEKRSYRFR